MSLIKKCDVKRHLSARSRKELHLGKPAGKPDTAGFSKAEPGACEAGPSDFAKDFHTDHSLSGTILAPIDPLTGSIVPQAPAASKSALA